MGAADHICNISDYSFMRYFFECQSNSSIDYESDAE